MSACRLGLQFASMTGGPARGSGTRRPELELSWVPKARVRPSGLNAVPPIAKTRFHPIESETDDTALPTEITA
ncbi:hypothetical protein [Streptomyces sp. NPDC056938]|uniref:hypothetical protein n=1 Tax=unclassified Streptomyces TaxID=2593676 RepID=UPI00363B9CBF